MNQPPLSDVRARHETALLARPGVVGVYEGLTDDGRPCITVMLADSTAQQGIPAQLEGWPVKLEFGGPIRPLDGNP